MKFAPVCSLVRFISAAVAAAIATAVQAQVVGVSSLGGASVGTIYSSAPRVIGQSFTTDNSAATFSLTTVSLMFFQNTGTIADFSVSIRTNSASLPGTVLGTLTGSVSPTAGITPQQYDYTSGGITLAANTTYWVTWGYSTPTGGGTFFGNPQVNTGVTGQWTLGNSALSTDGGSNWFPSTSAPQVNQIAIQATATAIPEPGTYAVIAGLAMLGYAAVRRRRTVARARA